MHTVCVYAGSTNGNDPSFCRAARALGRAIASRGQRLVFGGGRSGLMGVLADAALGAQGEVIGVIPDFLTTVEMSHPDVDLRVVESMHDRKREMAVCADAFVALPGGLGTLEEIIEMWTWTHLGLQDKPIGLLDVDGYYAKLLEFFETSVHRGLVAQESYALLHVASDPDQLLDALEAFEPPSHPRVTSPPATERG